MSDAEQNEYLSDPTGGTMPADDGMGAQILSEAGEVGPEDYPASTGPQPVAGAAGTPPGQEPLPAAPSAGPAGPSAQEPLPPAAVMPPPSGSGTVPPVRTGDASDDDRLLAALCWLSLVIFQIPLVSFVLLLAEPNKNRPFQRYHAINSIGFWVAAIVYEILLAIVSAVVGAVTLGCGLACMFPLIFVPHIIALYYAYESFVGRRPVIPAISEFMRGQGWE